MRRIAECRASFLQLIDSDPDLVIYGVTTSMGELASRRLERDERDRHARIKAFAAATSFGDPLPDRVVRAIVLARLANFLEGNAATTPRMALAVAAMLDGGPMPGVPISGQGGAGEILALYPLFAELSTQFDLEVKERGSLINGSPAPPHWWPTRRWRRAAACGWPNRSSRCRSKPSAHRWSITMRPSTGSGATNMRRPPCVACGSSWSGAGGGRRNYQAPVSYRIVPRILGPRASRPGRGRAGGGRSR